MKTIPGIISILLFSLFGRIILAQEIIYLSIHSSDEIVKTKLQTAAMYYGLTLKEVLTGSINAAYINKNPLPEKLATELNEDTKVLVISPKALNEINCDELLKLIGKRKLSIFIPEITDQNNSMQISKWSEGTIEKCVNSSTRNNSHLNTIKFTEDNKILNQLSSQEIPLIIKESYSLRLNRPDKAEALMYSDPNRKDAAFLKAEIKGKEIFFSTRLTSQIENEKEGLNYKRNTFVELAPYLIFLKYACGKSCLRSPGYYANFTIDDPWLTEPYGFLSYSQLLEKMRQYKFHTTIAFIPWNYDRSDMDVAKLIRENPENYSICYHGDDHGPNEFQSNRHNEEKIRQAIARMAKFTDMTKIPVDQVMVFPRGIGNKESLSLLKKYNFYSTINSVKTPSDAKEEEKRNNDDLDKLRIVTMKYSGFPSLERYSLDNITKADIVINLFLENPILIYSHHNYTKEEAKLLKLVKFINWLQPDIQWKSLGYIMQYLYYTKPDNKDMNYNKVMAFSSNINLINKSEKKLHYSVVKAEPVEYKYDEISVNNLSAMDKTRYIKNEINIPLDIIPNGTAQINLRYNNNLDLRNIDISKNNLVSIFYRRLSDFRDITLNKTNLGSILRSIYYDSGINKYGFTGVIVLFIVFTGIICLIVYFMYLNLKKYKRSVSFTHKHPEKI